ncbi:MAG TPA: hypothetical protein VGM36_14645 [Rhizomicrobium sp.]|jgi:hypothetical protein
MKFARLIVLSLPLLLSACSSMLANQGVKNLKAKCAEQGKQFVEDKVEKNEYIVASSATVSGRCVGADDPDYVAPKQDAR